MNRPSASAAPAPRHGGGLAAWSVRHPVGVVMIALAVCVVGLFSLTRLGVDLLPHIIYPDVRVRVMDPGVPAVIMEDRVTRQLEEQLAVTEDAVSVQSRTSEGRSEIDLSFSYGKDIDVALRDASTRLDRARRELPDSIEPPVIYKRDPSQIPVLEFAVSSRLRDPVELRDWIDYTFANWFINLSGVAAVEVGGAPLREILVLPDQQRLAGQGLGIEDIVDALKANNIDVPGGPLRMSQQEISGRTSGRLRTVEAIGELPIGGASGDPGALVRLQDVAEVIDSHADELLRVRLNGVPGLKLSFQKQPQANTVAVADTVKAQLAYLREQKLIPADVEIRTVSDQSIFVGQAIRNAAGAALTGGLLAMLVVYLFLGDIRRTLIVGSGIPIAILVALILMATSGLTLNVMTLGGIALGVGMLVDNTIVMLENVYRHQRMGKRPDEAAVDAAVEVNSAVVASTSTNLAAVLPFLFIGGLVGLLFRELVATISAAIVASLAVALTVVPALGARVPVSRPGLLRRLIDAIVGALQWLYAGLLRIVLRLRWLIVVVFVAALVWALPVFQTNKEVFLPDIDDGAIYMDIVADSGINLEEMDDTVARLESLVLAQPEVVTVFAQIGGFVFGRSEFQRSNRSRLAVQLVPVSRRAVSGVEWIARMEKEVAGLQMAGVRVRMRMVGIRGLIVSRGDDDISIRVQGSDLDTLADIGDEILLRLSGVPGLGNLQHSSEDILQELAVILDRERATALGYSVEEVGRAVRVALQGVVVTDFIDEDRQYDVRMRLPRSEVASPRDVETILLFPSADGRPAVYLGDVADVEIVTAPADIRRDRQRRIIEISGTVTGERSLGEVNTEVHERLTGIELPPGYNLYDESAGRALREGEQLAWLLMALAVFLVFVVMAVQYESLRNPLVIMFSVPFAVIGVAAGIHFTGMPLSMPMWLGLIMLAGIVVNNAIVLVEYIELERSRGLRLEEAVVEAGRLRLRPIIMTTATTVIGMTPLALGIGEGSEMLQPLALTIVWGLLFSALVSLLLVPAVYRIAGRRDPGPAAETIEDHGHRDHTTLGALRPPG